MGKRVIREYNGNTWTKAQYFGAIRSALRGKFRYWKPMQQALLNQRRAYKGTNKLQKWEYQCQECKKWYMRKEIEIHHLQECGKLNRLEDISGFVTRLCCEDVNGYKILCKACHKKQHRH